MKKLNEFLNEAKENLDNLDLDQVKKLLYDNGFKDSYPHHDRLMVRYTAKNNNSFMIWLDDNKPNKVVRLTGTKPNSIKNYGLIGSDIKDEFKKFTFKSPSDLIQKLEKINNTTDDSSGGYWITK